MRMRKQVLVGHSLPAPLPRGPDIHHDRWDKAGLSQINREKIDAIREAIKEPERAGYIVRSRERDEKGRLCGADHVIYDFRRCGNNPYSLIAHAVKQRVELPSLRRFLRCLVWKKELVYGYVITGYKLIKDLQACPKAAKSYKGTGLFATIIHPTTFYCSFLCLDMLRQFL